MEYAITTTENKGDFAIVEAGQGATIRATSTASEKILFNAVNGQGEKVKDFLGVELAVTHIVVTSADVSKEFSERENQDAEKVSKPCAHFFTTDGHHISSISTGIVRAVEKLFDCGMNPVDGGEPLKMMFITVNTKNGVAHNFTLLED